MKIKCQCCSIEFKTDNKYRKFCSKSCSAKIVKRKYVDLDYLIQLKKEGKTNYQCAELIGVNENIIGNYVNQLVREGRLQQPQKIAWNKGIRETLPVTCRYCSKELLIAPCKYKQSKNKVFYCDKQCEAKGKSNPILEKTCKHCNNIFQTKHNNQVYCCNVCKLQAMNHLLQQGSKEKYTSERRTESIKKMWVDHKEEILKKRNTEEYKQKLSDIMKIRAPKIWSNITPEQAKVMTLKAHQTKKENGSYGRSLQEDNIYSILQTRYPDIVRQHTDEQRYPFACDFYIPSKDLFIEYQGHWTHGTQPFNGYNTPIEWLDKQHESDFYKNAIETYTIADPYKREFVIANNLNFVEMWGYHNDEYLFKQIERADGLKFQCSKEIMDKELNIIQTHNNGFRTPSNFNSIILNYQLHFFETEKEMYRNPILQRKLILNRCKYLNKEEHELTDNELLRGFKISGIHYGYSHFSPFWIKAFIEKYKIESIYDPCCGWGHRLLGSSNIKYYGNDIDKRTIDGLNSIITDFNLGKAVVFSNDCTEFVPDFKYDAVFTCPPYFDLEDYKYCSSKKYSNIQAWIDGFVSKMIENSLKGCLKYFAIVINELLKDLFISYCLKIGLKLMEILPVGNGNGSHFKHVKKSSKNQEFLLVLKI